MPTKQLQLQVRVCSFEHQVVNHKTTHSRFKGLTNQLAGFQNKRQFASAELVAKQQDENGCTQWRITSQVNSKLMQGKCTGATRTPKDTSAFGGRRYPCVVEADTEMTIIVAAVRNVGNSSLLFARSTISLPKICSQRATKYLAMYVRDIRVHTRILLLQANNYPCK